MICPKCGESNAENFRFCGMCGAGLGASKPASAAKAEIAPDREIPVALKIPANPPRAGANTRVEPISGPSLLGLDQPSTDSLREKAFSGLDSFFEPEEPKTGGRRIVLIVVLLAALGGAGWWVYTNYLGIAETRKPESATSSGQGVEAPPEKPAAKQDGMETKSAETKSAESAPSAVPAATAVPENQVLENQAEKASANPENKPAVRAPETAKAKPAQQKKAANAAKIAKTQPAAAMRHGSVKTAVPKAAPMTPADSGDAFFRKGEAYLYGRGVAENCDQAVKYLKGASAKFHAKARSTMGTMYATGHCVPRDLPTSYLWFALALRADPNNQILEKDLSAVWNQMTPPERQLATKMKQ